LGIAFAGGCCVAILLAAWRGQFPWRRAVAVSLLLAVTAAAVVGGVIVREHMTAALIGGQTYLDIFKAKAATGVSGYLNGLQICIADAGRDMIPGMLKSYGSPGKWLNINLLLLYLPLFVLLAWGWTRWVRRQTDPLAWSVPLYLTVLIAYWGDSGGRYCLPLLPALWVCLWFALERLGNQRFRILAVLWGLHVAAALGYWLGVDLPWARAINRQWPLVERVVAEVRSEPGPMQRCPISRRCWNSLWTDQWKTISKIRRCWTKCNGSWCAWRDWINLCHRASRCIASWGRTVCCTALEAREGPPSPVPGAVASCRSGNDGIRYRRMA
jgi:hypothetical protein